MNIPYSVRVQVALIVIVSTGGQVKLVKFSIYITLDYFIQQTTGGLKSRHLPKALYSTNDIIQQTLFIQRNSLFIFFFSFTIV